MFEAQTIFSLWHTETPALWMGRYRTTLPSCRVGPTHQGWTKITPPAAGDSPAQGHIQDLPIIVENAPKKSSRAPRFLSTRCHPEFSQGIKTPSALTNTPQGSGSCHHENIYFPGLELWNLSHQFIEQLWLKGTTAPEMVETQILNSYWWHLTPYWPSLTTGEGCPDQLRCLWHCRNIRITQGFPRLYFLRRD